VRAGSIVGIRKAVFPPALRPIALLVRRPLEPLPDVDDFFKSRFPGGRGRFQAPSAASANEDERVPGFEPGFQVFDKTLVSHEPRFVLIPKHEGDVVGRFRMADENILGDAPDIDEISRRLFDQFERLLGRNALDPLPECGKSR